MTETSGGTIGSVTLRDAIDSRGGASLRDEAVRGDGAHDHGARNDGARNDGAGNDGARDDGAGGDDARDVTDQDAGALPSLAAVRRVVVGSTNPVKLAAARAVLAPLIAPGATIESVAAASGVPDQPWGDEETLRGARTRASAALAASGADLGVAFEGGVVAEEGGGVRTCAWAAVVDRTGREAVGGSLAMPLPPAVATMVRAGTELGHAMDALTQAHNTKQKLGAVGVLTAGLVDRQRAYEVLLTYALARWLAAEYWKDRG